MFLFIKTIVLSMQSAAYCRPKEIVSDGGCLINVKTIVILFLVYIKTLKTVVPDPNRRFENVTLCLGYLERSPTASKSTKSICLAELFN